MLTSPWKAGGGEWSHHDPVQQISTCARGGRRLGDLSDKEGHVPWSASTGPCVPRVRFHAQRCAHGRARLDEAAYRVLFRGFLPFSELGLPTCKTGIAFYMF